MNLISVLQSLVIAFAPLYILRFYFFIPTTFLELLILTTITVTFIDFLKSAPIKSGSGSKLKDIRTKFDMPIMFFLIVVTFEAFKSLDLMGGLGILKAYFIEPILFFYCLVYQARKQGSKYIYYSLFLSGFLLSVLGVLQKVTNDYTLAPHEILRGRISAVYNSANALALFIGPLIILSFAYAIKLKSKWRIFFYLLTFVFFTVLIWSRSRGGLFAEIIGLGFFFYLSLVFRQKILKKFWYILPAIILSILIFWSINFYQKTNFIPFYNNHPYTLGDTLQIRYFIWVGTINMLNDNPLFGAGLNGFKKLYTNQYRLPQFQEEFQYPHNLFLTFWTETGIFGLVGFLWITTRCFAVTFKKIKDDKNLILGAGLISMVVFWLVHGVVDVPYFKNDLSVEFWTILALIELLGDDNYG